MEQQCFKNVLLFKLTFTGTHIDHNYFSCTIREKDQLHIFFVLFVYLESMLTIYNWIERQENIPFVVLVPMLHEAIDGKIFNLSMLYIEVLKINEISDDSYIKFGWLDERLDCTILKMIVKMVWWNDVDRYIQIFVR